MDLKVDTGGLQADGTGLSSTSTLAGAAPQCEPAAADPVSRQVATALTQWSQALWTLMEHAGRQREAGGVALEGTSAHLGDIDGTNAANISNAIAGDATQASPAPPIPTPMASVPVPTLPLIPNLPSPPPMTGEQVSGTVHSGPGPDRLRAFAQQWRNTVAPHIQTTADEARRYGNSVQQNWDDGDPQAGRNVIEHADWLESALHPHALSLADAADEAARHAQTVIDNTARPEEFRDIHTRLNTAEANYRASGGRNAGQLIALNNE